MKRISLLMVLPFLGAALIFWTVSADSSPEQQPEIPEGGALYDNWYAEIGVEPPAGNMPIWSRQSTNTRSGPDTWRCVSCHGWDYQGKDGAYRAGSSYTGFPNIFEAIQTLSEEEIVSILKGGKDEEHDFSPYLNDEHLASLAVFLKHALIDDNLYIDPRTLDVISGDYDNGRVYYEEVCASCHGEDGNKILFRFEGMNAGLAQLAALDPWRFLHKTRFGTPGTPMPIGYDLGWTAQEGRDVLFYMQMLAAVREGAAPPVMDERLVTPQPQPGGPARNMFTGILTALGAMAAGLGFNILVGGVLIGIILLVVWLIRGQR